MTISQPAQAATELDHYHEIMSRNAAIKRFYERWTADDSFRQELLSDPERALADAAIAVHVADIEPLLRPDATANAMYESAAFRSLWDIAQAKTQWVNAFYREEAVPADARIRAWRRRRIAAQTLDLGPFHSFMNIHASLAVELTQGCSVGCWFCALSPERLESVFEYNDHTAREWKEMIRAFSHVLGDGVKSGFLYWATDPLDNPGYESFCLDFCNETGIFPPTTTALYLRDTARTRNLLRISEARGCWLNRFSVLSAGLMRRLHREFSAGELALVECLPLTKQAAFAFGNAGRFRERTLQDPGLLVIEKNKFRQASWYENDPRYKDSDDYPHSSIACVTGFLVNLCKRRLELISPCTATDAWPLGYVVYGSRGFGNPDELAAGMNSLISEWMPIELQPHFILAFHQWLVFEPLADGFALHGRFKQTLTFRNGPHSGLYAALGTLLNEGRHSEEEICRSVHAETEAQEPDIRNALADIFDAGVLAEECFRNA
jgi:radical SAM family RiPP maturation amino acid epimerase